MGQNRKGLTKKQRRVVNSNPKMSDSDLAARISATPESIVDYRTRLYPKQKSDSLNVPLYRKPLVIGIATGILLLSITGGAYAVSKYGGSGDGPNHTITIDSTASSFSDLPPSKNIPLPPDTAITPSRFENLDGYTEKEFISKYGIESTLDRRDKSENIPNLSIYNDFLTDSLTKDGVSTKISRIEFTDMINGMWAIPFSDKDKGFAKSSETIVINSIDDFFEYYHGIIPKRDYKIIVPQSVSEITEPIVNGKLALYLVNENGSFNESRYLLHMEDGTTQHVRGTKLDRVEGEITQFLRFYFEGEGRIKLEFSRSSPILISSDEKDVFLYENGPIETFHSILLNDRAKYIEDELSEYSVGRTSLPFGEVNSINDKWTQREEHVVHAMVSIWLLDYANRTANLSQEDVWERIEIYKGQDRYQFVPDLVRQFKDKAGAKSLFEMYKTQPDKLFEPFGM